MQAIKAQAGDLAIYDNCTCGALQVEQALQKYQTAIQYHERYAEAHCNMGVLHKQAGQLDDAIKAHEKAFSIAPCNDTIRRNLALACTEKGTQLKTDGDAAGGAPV